MGADYYEVFSQMKVTLEVDIAVICFYKLKYGHRIMLWLQTEADKRFLAAKGSVPIGIGKNTHIKRAIIDKNARIGDNVKVLLPC